MSRHILRSLAPPPVVALRHAWLRWQQRRREAWIFRRTGGRIVAGPFAGMAFVDDADGIPLAPKLLGTYERELFPWIRSITAAEHDLVINIGAGEGYYTVGLLGLMPGTRAVAFETGTRRQQLIDRLARRNEVRDRLDIRGTATTDSLQAVLAGARRPVVLCDIEGAEKALLDPDRIPGLRTTDMVVEAHDFIDASISPTLRARFGDSHVIEVVATEPRTLGDLASLPVSATPQVLEAVSERRPCAMEWLRLSARSP